MQITARTNGGMRVEATDGTASLAMDEPVAAGGTGTSLSPQQALASALAGCTAMTLKLYSARKSWPLEDVVITVDMEPAPRTEPDTPNKFTQTIELIGDLDDAQRERLLQIAGKCPVHRIVEGPNAFEERLAATADTE